MATRVRRAQVIGSGATPPAQLTVGLAALAGKRERGRRTEGGITMTRTDQQPSRAVIGTLTEIGIAMGVVVMLLTSDVILGVIAGAA
jgi:hypothetical protein